MPAPSRIRTVREVEALARVHTHRAIEVLAEIMEDDEAGRQVRLNAAVALLDRGWGKVQQNIDPTQAPGMLTDEQLSAEISRRMQRLAGVPQLTPVIDHDAS